MSNIEIGVSVVGAMLVLAWFGYLGGDTQMQVKNFVGMGPKGRQFNWVSVSQLSDGSQRPRWEKNISTSACRKRCQEDPNCLGWETCPYGPACAGCFNFYDAPEGQPSQALPQALKTGAAGWNAEVLRTPTVA